MGSDVELTITNDQRQALVVVLRELQSAWGYENAFVAAILKQARWTNDEEDYLLSLDEKAAVHNLNAVGPPTDEAELTARFAFLKAFRAEQRQWNTATKTLHLSKEAASFLKATLKKEMKGFSAEKLFELAEAL